VAAEEVTRAWCREILANLRRGTPEVKPTSL
jgi:hypothetical protein